MALVSFHDIKEGSLSLLFTVSFLVQTPGGRLASSLVSILVEGCGRLASFFVSFWNFLLSLLSSVVGLMLSLCYLLGSVVGLMLSLCYLLGSVVGLMLSLCYLLSSVVGLMLSLSYPLLSLEIQWMG